MHNRIPYVVLLTGTIDSGVFNNTGNRIQDIPTRLSQYESSITSYIADSVFDHIVFAENSGYPFPYEKYIELAQVYGKQFEYVKCPSYISETVRRGKSYGEARLIDDALRISQLLQNADLIYKITGRIFLKNSVAICSSMQKHKNEFLVYDSKKWCLTNIFKFSKTDYLNHWEKVYEQCDEKSRNDIEFIFFRILENAPELDVGSFSVWPYFDGIQGATLEPYSGNIIERTLRNILCKLGCFHFGSVASKLLKI